MVRMLCHHQLQWSATVAYSRRRAKMLMCIDDKYNQSKRTMLRTTPVPVPCQQLCETKVKKNSTGNTLHSESNISTSQWRQRKHQWSLKSLMFIYCAPWLCVHKFKDLYNKAASSRLFQSGPTRHCNTKCHTASMAIKQLNREPIYPWVIRCSKIN